jgi:hypothetical protein
MTGFCASAQPIAAARNVGVDDDRRTRNGENALRSAL